MLVDAAPESAMLIRRAKRVADFIGAECFAVAVQPSGDLSGFADAERQAVERHLNFARNLRIETRVLGGPDIAATLIDFARRNEVTQIFLARHVRGRRLFPPLARDLVQRVVDLAKDMQVIIVSGREPVDRL